MLLLFSAFVPLFAAFGGGRVSVTGTDRWDDDADGRIDSPHVDGEAEWTGEERVHSGPAATRTTETSSGSSTTRPVSPRAGWP